MGTAVQDGLQNVGRCGKLYLLRRHPISTDPTCSSLACNLGTFPWMEQCETLRPRPYLVCMAQYCRSECVVGWSTCGLVTAPSKQSATFDCDLSRMCNFSFFGFHFLLSLSHWCVGQHLTGGLMLRRCVVCSCSCQEHVWWKPMQMFFANVGL